MEGASPQQHRTPPFSLESATAQVHAARGPKFLFQPATLLFTFSIFTLHPPYTFPHPQNRTPARVHHEHYLLAFTHFIEMQKLLMSTNALQYC